MHFNGLISDHILTCIHVDDFNVRNKCLTAKLLKQGRLEWLSPSSELVSKFYVGLKSLLRQGLSEPEFYGDKNITGRTDFRKVIIHVHHKRIGYNLNVMRQSACLVINPITFDNFAVLFNFTLVDRASDSMTAPT